MMWVPSDVWERMAMPLLLVAFVLLVIVLIPGLGHEVNGSRRWLRLGFMNFQASEMARVLLLTYLSSYVVRRQKELKDELKGFLKPLGVLMGAAFLLLLEPDFGAATVLMATGLGVLFLAGVKLRHFLALVTLAAAGMAVIAVTSAYRLKRLTTFLDPWADPFNAGFQLTQSLIAIGRGEMFGVGLGSSVQKLFYLPEAHTDFVFAVLAEELGLAGVLLTLSLFMVLVWRALHISKLAAEAGLAFQAYCAAGFGIWLALQTFINVGVNMGMLPTKGLTLPLMSFGSSSLLVTLGWLGLLMRINHEAHVTGRLAVSRKERAA
jgi:cell division protein FtsW